MKLPVFVLASFISLQGWAIQDLSIYAGAGALSHNVGGISQNSSGSTGFSGTFFYPLILQTSFGLGGQWHLAPAVEYTLFGSLLIPKTAPDGGSKSGYFIFSLPVVNTFDESGEGFEWEAGPVFLNYTLQGSGGVIALANGSGPSENFALPGNSQSAWTMGLLLGLGYDINSFRLNLDSITEGLFSNNRRTFSFMFSLTYNVIGGL